jgi:hypothetical protein
MKLKLCYRTVIELSYWKVSFSYKVQGNVLWVSSATSDRLFLIPRTYYLMLVIVRVRPLMLWESTFGYSVLTRP